MVWVSKISQVWRSFFGETLLGRIQVLRLGFKTSGRPSGTEAKRLVWYKGGNGTQINEPQFY